MNLYKRSNHSIIFMWQRKRLLDSVDKLNFLLDLINLSLDNFYPSVNDPYFHEDADPHFPLRYKMLAMNFHLDFPD